MEYLGLYQVILALFYCFMIIITNRERNRLQKQKDELRSKRDSILFDAELEAKSIVSAVKKRMTPITPLNGPTPNELEANEALRIAWDEFNVIYKLTTPKSD